MRNSICFSVKNLCLSVILLPMALAAQDPHFSQYYHSPLTLNPGLVAQKSDMQLILNYRNQWASLSQPFSTPQASLLYPLLKNDGTRYGGLGLSFINDKLGQGGMLQTTGVAGAFAYNFSLESGHYLSMGMQGGYYQKKLAIGELTSGSQWQNGGYNPQASLGEDFTQTTVTLPDMSAGILWYLEEQEKSIKAYAGISLFHLNQPNESFYGQDYQLPMRISYFGGVKLISYNQFDIIPNMLYMFQRKAQELSLGSLIRYNFTRSSHGSPDDGSAGLGIWYRNKDAIVLALDISHSYFTVGFSYDINVSTLSETTRGKGAMEIAVVLKKYIGKKPRPVKRSYAPKRKMQKKTPKAEPKDTIVRTAYITLLGTVQDAATQEALEADIQVLDIDEKVIAEIRSDGKTGAYKVAFIPNREAPGPLKYMIVAKKEGYIYYSEELVIPKADKTKTIQRDIPLQKIALGVKVVLNDIFFDLGKATLQPASAQALKRLAELLEEQPHLKIEISGHTDNTGQEAFNQKLSEQRAQAVSDHLVGLGIARERLKERGYGSSQPVETNSTAEGRAKNRRVEFKIIEN